MISIIKITAHRINQTRVFIFGLVFSMLLVSIGISFTYEHIYAGKNKSDNAPPNGEMCLISSEISKQVTTKRIKKLFNGIRKETGVIFTNLRDWP